MKAIVVYYSYTGNTAKIAKLIAERLGCESRELVPSKPYSSDYDKVVDDAQRQVKQDYKPEIEKLDVDLNDYDTIFLGSPVWWYTIASPVNSFLSEYNLADKTLVPFITNAGWLGHTIKDIEKKTTAQVANPINIVFDGSRLKTSEKEIDSWLEKLSEER